ncbi:MAG: hypothetical protein RLY71_159 [Pseudomonadota bacterium]|jgi:predicted secreted protein
MKPVRDLVGRRLPAWMGASLLALGAAGPAVAATDPPPENVVNLSASASMEVTKDWLTVHLQTSREGADLAAVQGGLKQVLDAALAEARRAAAEGALEVRTGSFQVGPRYGREGRINGWQGSAELILQGRDLARIATLAGRLNGMAVSGTGYSISPQMQEKHEAELAAQAIARFRARAQDLAQQFGFAGYTLREVTVQNGAEMAPAPMLMRSMAVSADAAAPLPIEAGKGTLSATVQGSVQLQRVQLPR